MWWRPSQLRRPTTRTCGLAHVQRRRGAGAGRVQGGGALTDCDAAAEGAASVRVQRTRLKSNNEEDRGGDRSAQ